MYFHSPSESGMLSKLQFYIAMHAFEIRQIFEFHCGGFYKTQLHPIP